VTNLEELVDALASFEVHPGFPDRRRVLAGQLLAAGVTPADIEVLGDHCLRTVVDKSSSNDRRTGGDRRSPTGAAARVLVTLLADPEKRASRLKDLADIDRAREARRSRLAGRPPGDRPSTPAPQQGEDAAQWQYDRNCVIAYARAVCDGRGLKVAADELGVPIEQIGAMIERGRLLREHGPGRVEDPKP
jgi:hypothetical protein